MSSSDGESVGSEGGGAIEHFLQLKVAADTTEDVSLTGTIMHITNVALADLEGTACATVMVKSAGDDEFAIVAHLTKANPSQMVDLTFYEADMGASFRVVGRTGVHFLGQVSLSAEEMRKLEEEDSEDEEDSEEEDSEEEEEDSEGARVEELDDDADEEGEAAPAPAEAPAPSSRAERRRAKKAADAAKKAAEAAKAEAEAAAAEEAARKEAAAAKAAAEKKAKNKRSRDADAEVSSAKKAREPPVPPSKVVTMKNGLKYQDIVTGAGPKPSPGKRVQVHYVGKLTNGKVFDKSKTPFKFRLGVGQVIKGWDLGVASMRVGGRRRLTVPASLGYGRRGSPPVIPPNATLIFDVELLSTK